MPVQLHHDAHDDASSAPSIHPTRPGVVQAVCPDKLARWRGKWVLIGDRAVFLVILQIRQEPGGMLPWGFTLAIAQSYQGFGASTPGARGSRCTA
jgi:hypothetical protein